MFGWVLPFAIFVVIIALFIVSMTRRRHGESEVAAPGWTATKEVFRDPTTKRLMRVWIDTAGERHYVPEK
jgi:hypothetical protein